MSKLTDADGPRLVAYGSESENAETDTWVDFARDCNYLSDSERLGLTEKSREVGAIAWQHDQFTRFLHLKGF